MTGILQVRVTKMVQSHKTLGNFTDICGINRSLHPSLAFVPLQITILKFLMQRKQFGTKNFDGYATFRTKKYQFYCEIYPLSHSIHHKHELYLQGSAELIKGFIKPLNKLLIYFIVD